MQIEVLDRLPIQLTWTEKLAYLTHQFLKMEQTACPVTHLFGDGRYIREMRIPEGTLFIGRPHRTGHWCELVSGSVIHVTPEGRFAIEAPFVMRSTPGYQMVFLALTEVIGRTSHPDSGERDIERLEEQIFESVESIDQLGAQVMRRLA